MLAGPQPKGTPPRAALAISYFADGARLLAHRTDPSVHKHLLHTEDSESYKDWIGDMQDGAAAVHSCLPLVPQ